jgi:hypothetical protein
VRLGKKVDNIIILYILYIIFIIWKFIFIHIKVCKNKVYTLQSLYVTVIPVNCPSTHYFYSLPPSNQIWLQFWLIPYIQKEITPKNVRWPLPSDKGNYCTHFAGFLWERRVALGSVQYTHLTFEPVGLWCIVFTVNSWDVPSDNFKKAASIYYSWMASKL